MTLKKSFDNSLRSIATEATSRNRPTTEATKNSSSDILDSVTEEIYADVPVTESSEWDNIELKIILKNINEDEPSFISEYTNGDTIEGELKINIPPMNEFTYGIKLAAVLMTLEGKCVVEAFVDVPTSETPEIREYSRTFLKLNNCIPYTFNDLNAVDDYEFEFYGNSVRTYIGLPMDGVLKPKTLYRVPFKFKLPRLLREGASSSEVHYSLLPPTLGINKKYGIKITDWKGDYPYEINQNMSLVGTKGHNMIDDNESDLLLVNDLCPKYPSISYTVNAKLIGYKESTPLEVLKSTSQDLRIISTGFWYSLEEEMKQDLVLKSLKEDNIPYECRVLHEKYLGEYKYHNGDSKLNNNILSLNLEKERAISNFKIMENTTTSSSNYKLLCFLKGSLNMTTEIPKRGFQYFSVLSKYKYEGKHNENAQYSPDYDSIMNYVKKLTPTDLRELSDIDIDLKFYQLDYDTCNDNMQPYSSNDYYSSKSTESLSIKDFQKDMLPPVLQKVKLSLNAFTLYNRTINPILFSTDMINNGELDESELANIENLKDLKWSKYTIPLSDTNIPENGNPKKSESLSTLLPELSESTSTDPVLIDHLPWTQCSNKSWSKNLSLKIRMSDLISKQPLCQPLCLVPSFHSLMISRLYELVVELEFEDCHALNINSDCSDETEQLIQLKIPVRFRNLN